ncbi:M28 family peptidase [Pleionea litopenaei]|uniref:M28 family peptidase n=1 Tax=Pleionea litopenaei TaxID=3070815 RepID=A0AA51RRL7_9GAMM|nr:M28 family peptidase [Pleionea sp. HL-JVS1]WMS86234.1 M28 family peptidase [Pleionea sp. HL-JVS1]
MQNSSNFFALILCVMLSGCQPSSPEQTKAPKYPEATPSALKAHIEFLASDLLEGRDTGSRGYDIAANYVVSHFMQYGLTPAGDNGSYLQQVTFRQRQLVVEETTFSVSGDQSYTLSLPNDFVTSGSSMATQQKVSAPLYFVGYGISAPHLNHDDYADIDVTGKIVVIVNDKPSALPSEEAAHFVSGHQRALAAAKHGAVGIIYLQTEQGEQRYSFERLKGRINRPSLNWLTGEGQVGNLIPEIKVGALLSIQAAEKLLSKAPFNYATISQKLTDQEPLPKFEVGITANLQVTTKHSEITSPNVVGIVEGTDPQLKNEYVVYSAHLDHIGVHSDSTSQEDVINNGAMDNASGTAIMLETARLFSENPPKRSVLFVAVTGEEKGLLGSDYFAQHPTVPIDQLVANINLDMPLILYPIGDVIAFGAEHSTMSRYVQNAAEKVGLQLSPDPMPEQNIFVRSDHYSFVKQGVPSVFLVPGFKSLDESIDGGKIFQKFFHQHYHQPSDEATLPIDYEAGAKFTQVNYLIGTEIANSDNRPNWNEGDFFGDTFGQNK